MWTRAAAKERVHVRDNTNPCTRPLFYFELHLSLFQLIYPSKCINTRAFSAQVLLALIRLGFHSYFQRSCPYPSICFVPLHQLLLQCFPVTHWLIEVGLFQKAVVFNFFLKVIAEFDICVVQSRNWSWQLSWSHVNSLWRWKELWTFNSCLKVGRAAIMCKKP